MVSDYGSTSFNLINMSSQCNFFSSLAQHPSTVVLTSMFMNACSTLILLRRGGNVPECSFVFVCVQCLCVNKITHLNKLCINIHENFGRGTCNVHLGTSKMDQILFGMIYFLIHIQTYYAFFAYLQYAIQRRYIIIVRQMSAAL